VAGKGTATYFTLGGLIGNIGTKPPGSTPLGYVPAGANTANVMYLLQGSTAYMFFPASMVASPPAVGSYLRV
jgi:hypothetical protein